MKRNKIKKIIALFIFVLSFTVVLIIFLRKPKTNGGEESFLSEGQMKLHLVQTDGEKEIFELYAERHFPDKLGRYHLSGNIKLKIFGKAEGKDILIRGDSGIYEKDLSFVTIKNSEVTIEDLNIKSGELVYTSEGNIKSYSLSKFEHKYGNGEADSFIYDLKSKRISASKFKGDIRKEGNFHGSTDKIVLSYPENSIFMEGNTFIEGKEFALKCEKLYMIFKDGKINYARGEGNSELTYYGKIEEGEGIAEILKREGEKTLKCQKFEVKREENLFMINLENNCQVYFPFKKGEGEGILRAQILNLIYQKGKGIREGKAEGDFYFIDSDLKMEAKNIWGKSDMEFKEWELVKAEGNVRFEGDVIFECGIFSKDKDIIILQKERPYIKRDGEIVYADKIEYDSGKKLMKGEGNVKAFLGERSFSADIPFFKKGKRILARSNYILWNEKDETINFKGNAILEQEEQFLKSEDLFVEKEKGTFATKKGTEFLFLTEKERISGKCDSMEYSKDKNILNLSGDSSINTDEYSIRGASIKIGIGERELNFIEGISKVKFKSKEIEGEGDKLFFDLKNKKAVLEGNSSVKDEKRGKMRGKKIFIDFDKNEIRIEGNISEAEVRER